MSGKPSTEGIESLRRMIDHMAALSEEAEHLSAGIKPLQDRLTFVRSEYAALATQLPEVFKVMDIHTSGNAGWEQRITWAMQELARQYRKCLK
jgi:hypothetical protein